MRLKYYKKDKEFLTKPCEDVSLSEGKLVAHQLLKALHVKTISMKNPVGLASNQIGLTAPVFIAYINQKWRSFINPKIEKHSKETKYWTEGCLSFPDNKIYKTNRYEWVVISYLKSSGKRVQEKFEGTHSIIVQHEIDHLNGKVCKDGGVNE